MINRRVDDMHAIENLTSRVMTQRDMSELTEMESRGKLMDAVFHIVVADKCPNCVEWNDKWCCNFAPSWVQLECCRKDCRRMEENDSPMEAQRAGGLHP